MTDTQALKNWNRTHAKAAQCAQPNWKALIDLAGKIQGSSLNELAGIMGYSPSYVSIVRTGKQVPSQAFARRLEEVI